MQRATSRSRMLNVPINRRPSLKPEVKEKKLPSAVVKIVEEKKKEVDAIKSEIRQEMINRKIEREYGRPSPLGKLFDKGFLNELAPRLGLDTRSFVICTKEDLPQNITHGWLDKRAAQAELKLACVKIGDTYINETISLGLGTHSDITDILFIKKLNDEVVGDIIGFIMVEKGECAKYPNTVSVRLICTNTNVSGFGSILIAMFLCSIIKYHTDLGINCDAALELASSYTNVEGLCLYGKFGFEYVPDLVHGCYPEYGSKPTKSQAYSNLPMYVDLTYKTIEDIVAIHLRTLQLYKKHMICSLRDAAVQKEAAKGAEYERLRAIKNTYYATDTDKRFFDKYDYTYGTYTTKHAKAGKPALLAPPPPASSGGNRKRRSTLKKKYKYKRTTRKTRR